MADADRSSDQSPDHRGDLADSAHSDHKRPRPRKTPAPPVEKHRRGKGGSLFGLHMSVGNGIRESLEKSAHLGLESVQVRTRSNTRWFTPPIHPQESAAFRRQATQFSRYNLLTLASNLINLASQNDATHQHSLAALYDELLRADALGMAWVVVQPGNHEGQSKRSGLCRIVQSLNAVLDRTRQSQSGILLKTASGEDHTLGFTFDQLAWIRRHLDNPRRVGVCIDIASIFVAGYDLRKLEAYEKTIVELDRVIGLQHVKALHLSDSSYPLGSHRVIHTPIGEGKIGDNGFAYIVNDPRLRHLPMIIVTPQGPEGQDGIRDLHRLSSLIGTVTTKL